MLKGRLLASSGFREIVVFTIFQKKLDAKLIIKNFFVLSVFMCTYWNESDLFLGCYLSLSLV